jgi:hypothetical protein
MIGTRPTELGQQVNIELNIQVTDSTLRATPTISRGTSLLKRAMCAMHLAGFREAQQRKWICAEELPAAQEGIQK